MHVCASGPVLGCLLWKSGKEDHVQVTIRAPDLIERCISPTEMKFSPQNYPKRGTEILKVSSP